MAKVNKNPRISVNKLAEYLEADSTRRKQIIYDAKYPEDFKALRYKDAKEVILQYLMVHKDKDAVAVEMDNLKKKKMKTPWQEQDRDLSLEMLESLLHIDISIFNGWDLKPFDDENKLLSIKGVSISVYPDIVVYRVVRGITNIGAVKIHLSKGFALSPEGQNIVGVLLFDYVKNHIAEIGEVASTKCCVSFDIFNGALQCCPGSTVVRMKKIEAACEEIALRWPTL